MPTKPKLEYYFLCEDIRQETGNKSTFLGVFDNPVLRPTALPLTMPKLCFRLVYTGVKQGQTIHISLRDPDDNVLAEIDGVVPKIKKASKLMKIAPTLRINAMFGNPEFRKEGVYRLETMFGKEGTELEAQFEVIRHEPSE